MKASSGGNVTMGLRLLAEFTVIMLGVLVALAADSWSSARRDRVVEREYLVRLLEDVRADRAENAHILASHSIAFEYADSLLGFRASTMRPEWISAFNVNCRDQGFRRDCFLEEPDWRLDRLIDGLMDPVRPGEIYSSMSYQEVVTRLLDAQLDPAAVLLENVLNGELSESMR